MTDPDLGLTTSTYDAAGNLKQTTDANMKIIAMGYDDLDRMISKQFDMGMTTYTYDIGGGFGKGRLTSESGPYAAATSTYDARGRKIGTSETIQGVVATFTMGYDSADNPISITYPVTPGAMTGETVTTSYDAAERPTQAQSSLGSTNYASGVSYTALGKLMGITLGNGVSEAYTYDGATQRLGQHQIGTGGALFNRSYLYDGVGNVKSITGDAASGPQSFTYDERDRLTQATATAPAPYSESDSYDTVGNLKNKGGTAYSYPGHTNTSSNRALPHAPATAVGGAYTYDEVGNTLTGNGRTLTWNSQNLPVTIVGGITTGGGGTPTPTPVPPATPTPPPVPSATPPGTARACGTAAAGMAPNLIANRGGATVAGGANLTNSRGGATVAGAPNLTANRGCTTGAMGGGLQPHGVTPGTETYTYDAEGARVSRQTIAGMTTLTTLYFGGLWEVEKETGATRAFYTLGGSTVAQRTRPGGMGTGTLVYLHGDHLGSVSILTDSTGAKVSGQEYGAWGQVRGGDNSTTTPIDFTGQHKDGTGLLYYGARYYDPALGRFLSADSVSGSKGDPQGLNRYSYVENNPTNKTDPSGHDPYSYINNGMTYQPNTQYSFYNSQTVPFYTYNNDGSQIFDSSGYPVIRTISSFSYMSSNIPNFNSFYGPFGPFDDHGEVLQSALGYLPRGYLGDVTFYDSNNQPVANVDALNIQNNFFDEIKSSGQANTINGQVAKFLDPRNFNPFTGQQFAPDPTRIYELVSAFDSNPILYGRPYSSNTNGPKSGAIVYDNLQKLSTNNNGSVRYVYDQYQNDHPTNASTPTPASRPVRFCSFGGLLVPC